MARNTDSLGLTMRPSGLHASECAAVVEKLKAVRVYWRWLIDHKTEFANLLGDFVVLPIQFQLDDIIDMCNVMLKAGFTRLRSLHCAAGNIWGLGLPRIERQLNSLARYMSRTLEEEANKRGMQDVIEAMLSSGGESETRIIRPDTGPRRAVADAGIAGWSQEDKRARLAATKIDVAIDSITGGRKAYISAVRGYLIFIKELGGERLPLPPTIEDLLLWSRFFRNAGTYSNYVSALRWVCEGCDLDCSVFKHPLLRRAKTALKLVTKPREKMWIGYELTLKLMRAAHSDGDLTCAMLYACAYIFMSRVPSELLPMQWGGSTITNVQGAAFRSALQGNDGEARLVLRTRKNARHGDMVRRDCICNKCKALCPVHIVLPWLRSHEVGYAPFRNFSASSATRKLRKHLATIGIDNPNAYSLHCFRRGAAQDLVQMGADIATLLAAGGWNSRACFDYVKPADLHGQAILEYIIDESESDRE